MNRIIRWLEAKMFRSKSVYPPVNPARTKPDRSELDLPKDTQDLVNDAPIPDIYADDQGGPAQDRKFLEPSSPDADKTTGFNPYDTAKLHKK